LIEPYEPVSPTASDNVNGDLIVWEGSKIVDPDGRIYEMKRRVGSGHFGQVYEALLTNPDEGPPTSYAMKISQSHPNALFQFEYESQALSFLVHQTGTMFSFQHSFLHQGHCCIVSTLLGPSVLDILARHSFQGIPLSLVQSVLRDSLRAVALLAGLGLVHCDIKPDNILFLSEESTSVQLIDFGSVCVVGDPAVEYAQSRYYRAPEVVLGFGLGPEADVWSLGCVAAELMLGLPLFPAVSQLHLLVLFEEMLGPFPRTLAVSDHFLPDGSLKPTDVLEQEFGEDFSQFQRYFIPTRLDDIVMSFALPDDCGEEEAAAELATRRVFLDLLRQMLELDPARRVTAADA
jgi:dual specificity protein kinase YAK1